MNEYSRDFSARLRPISLEEFNEYYTFLSGLDTNEFAVMENEGGLILNFFPKEANSPELSDNSNRTDEDIEYNEYDDYDEYDYDDYSLDNGVCVLVGYIQPEYRSGIMIGNDIQLGDQTFTLLDEESGLSAMAFPAYNMAREDIEAAYIGSKLESNIIQLEESIPYGLSKMELNVPDIIKEQYILSELDHKSGDAFNQIISGETGCGKTYKAINDEIDAGRKFAYIAPCRQLAYETFRYYADPQKDTLSSGEININGKEDGNFFGVFESMNAERLKEGGYDTLIIDEAHFIKDYDRGGNLLSLIAECREQDLNMKLLTATQNFRLHDFDEIHLKARFKVPEKVEVDYDEAYQNIKKGMQTIWFCGSIADTNARAAMLSAYGINAIAMNSSMTPSERIRAQIDFENKDVQVICATNVLAQGVNFECENLIIEPDFYETPEQLQQKIGRLGRPGTLNGKNEVYYYSFDSPREIRKDKASTKVEKKESDRSHIQKQLDNALYWINCGDSLSYNDIKYCIPEFKKWANEYKRDHCDLDHYMQFKFRDKLAIISDHASYEIEKLNALLSINPKNMRLDSFQDIDTVRRTQKYLSDGFPDHVLVNQYDLDDAYRTVTYGASLRFPSHQTKDEDIEAVRSLQKTLTDPDIRKRIEDRVKITLPEIVKHPERSPSWPGLMATAKDNAAYEYKCNGQFKNILEAIDLTIDNIVEEQTKLKQLILTNMRKTMDLDRPEKEREAYRDIDERIDRQNATEDVVRKNSSNDIQRSTISRFDIGR